MSTTTARKAPNTTGSKRSVSKKAPSKNAGSKKAPSKNAVSKKAGSKNAVPTKAGSKKAGSKKGASKKSGSTTAGSKKVRTSGPARAAARKNAPSGKSAARKRGSATKASLPDRVGARNLTARTAEVRAERRQRRRSVVIVLAVITVTGAALIGFLRSSVMDIDDVAIEGYAEVSFEEISQAAAVPIGTSLVDLDEKLIVDRVESLPGIRTAKVSRGWTGVVRITVTEREPILALPTSDGFVLVDSSGRQVRMAETLPDGFIAVIGLQASGVPGDPAPPGSTSVLRLMEAITPPVRQAVNEVIVTGTEMALSLNDGGRAVFGDDRQIDEKVVSLETLLLSVDMRCVHEIDLTVPSAPALSRIGEKGNPRDGLADLTKCS